LRDEKRREDDEDAIEQERLRKLADIAERHRLE